jgi:IPT/TIG domain
LIVGLMGYSPHRASASPLPTVTSVSPGAGPIAGGTRVIITGTGFVATSTTVSFGTTAAAGQTVSSPTMMHATSPAGTGTVDITVTNAGGTSATSLADEFSYVAIPTVVSLSAMAGPSAGGTIVVITGTSLSAASAVDFGSTAATSYTVTSPTLVTATAPAGTGTVDVTVTTIGGASATSLADQFSYVAVPGPGAPAATVPTSTPVPVAPPAPIAPPGVVSTVPLPLLVPTGDGVAATPTGSGYWFLGPGGQLSEHGNAGDFGSTNSTALNASVVAVNSTTNGGGYWLAAADGGVFAFGTPASTGPSEP